MALSIHTRTVRGVMIAQVQGRLSAGDAVRKFSDTLTPAIVAGNSRLVLDCSSIGYVDSTGIEAIVGIYQQTQKARGGFRILNPNPKLKELLRLTRLADVLGVSEDESEAVSALLGEDGR